MSHFLDNVDVLAHLLQLAYYGVATYKMLAELGKLGQADWSNRDIQADNKKD